MARNYQLSTRTSPPRRRTIFAVLVAVALYLWDDALLAAPIVASAHAWGPLQAFLVATPVYFAGSTAITLVLLRALGRPRSPSTRVTEWVERQAERPGRRWVGRVAVGGGVLGFVLSSFVLGGIVTTLLVRHAGVRVRIETVAVVASAFFAISFVGVYSGVSRIALAIGR